MFENFEEYMYGSLGLQSRTMVQFIKNMTDKLFKLKNDPNNVEIKKINIKKLVPKRFYLIQYNYNGNKIWCPILALDYKVIKNKNILYAVNLEYLPPLYKIKYFNLLFKKLSAQLNRVVNRPDLNSELPLPISFETIYNTLKQNGNMNYTITAYDYLKINKVYQVSILIAPEIIMCDPKRYNAKSMKDLYFNLQESDEKDDLGDIIEQYEKIIEQYQEDSIRYHKMVAAFEKNLKLIK